MLFRDPQPVREALSFGAATWPAARLARQHRTAARHDPARLGPRGLAGRIDADVARAELIAAEPELELWRRPTHTARGWPRRSGTRCLR